MRKLRSAILAGGLSRGAGPVELVLGDVVRGAGVRAAAMEEC